MFSVKYMLIHAANILYYWQVFEIVLNVMYGSIYPVNCNISYNIILYILYRIVI